jgi:hypothetical protein
VKYLAETQQCTDEQANDDCRYWHFDWSDLIAFRLVGRCGAGQKDVLVGFSPFFRVSRTVGFVRFCDCENAPTVSKTTAFGTAEEAQSPRLLATRIGRSANRFLTHFTSMVSRTSQCVSSRNGCLVNNQSGSGIAVRMRSETRCVDGRSLRGAFRVRGQNGVGKPLQRPSYDEDVQSSLRGFGNAQPIRSPRTIRRPRQPAGPYTRW